MIDGSDTIETIRPRCACGEEIDRFWPHCPWCGQTHRWGDDPHRAGAECPSCRWVTSPLHAFCPWCRHPGPLQHWAGRPPVDAAPGFDADAPCDWSCGGSVQYPMPYCPWCGQKQAWGTEDFEGSCPHCTRGVDDWMRFCPWCGDDSTGNQLVRPALDEVARLRPGISGVDPEFPRIVEIDRRFAVGKRPDEIAWPLLVELIIHELGHSFLYHHLTWARTERFRLAFGDVDAPYDVPDDAPVEFHTSRMPLFPTDHVTGYARFHPQEDFAETFRFYVTRSAGLDALSAELGATGKSARVLERFRILDEYVALLRSRPD
jgi:hypothetical protein